jgi:hypothetical protein
MLRLVSSGILEAARPADPIGACDSNPGAGVAGNAGMVKASIAFALNPHGPLRCPRAQLQPSGPSEAVERFLIGVVVLPPAEVANVPLARRIDGTPTLHSGTT